MKSTIALAWVTLVVGCAPAPYEGVVRAKTAQNEAIVDVSDSQLHAGDRVSIVHHECIAFAKGPPSCRGVASAEGEVTSLVDHEARVRFTPGAVVDGGDGVRRVAAR